MAIFVSATSQIINNNILALILTSSSEKVILFVSAKHQIEWQLIIDVITFLNTPKCHVPLVFCCCRLSLVNINTDHCACEVLRVSHLITERSAYATARAQARWMVNMHQSYAECHPPIQTSGTCEVCFS